MIDDIKLLDKDEIYTDYMSGMKYKEICDKYDISINTLKSWIKRYKWSKKGAKKGCTQNEKGAVKNKANNVEKKHFFDEINRVLENPELTEKQRLFCIYYIKCFNATKAAIKAGYSKNTAYEQGYQLLQKTSVKNEIDNLKKHKLNRAMLKEDDVFQMYIDIAFSDMTDYVEFGEKEITVDDETENTRMINFVKLKQSTEVDGTLISEVSKGKDGVKIKLQDKMKALQWLSDRMDLLPTEIREKLKLEREKFDLQQFKYAVDDEEDEENNIYEVATKKMKSRLKENKNE